MANSQKNKKWICVKNLVALATALIGFPIGYNATIISGAMLIIREQFNLNAKWQELITSIIIAAAAIFGLVAGWLNQWFGRKRLINSACAMFIIGAIFTSLANSKYMLVVGRFIQGIAAGISTTTVPAHIAEISPTPVRGVMLTLFPFCMAMGQWISGICAATLNYMEDQNMNWRLMFMFGTLPIIIQLFGLPFIPESPTWLISKGKIEKAEQTLISIHGKDCYENMLINQRVKRTEKRKWKERIFNYDAGNESVLDMLKIRETRRALFIGCSTQLFQQLTGVTCVLFYYGSIIKMSGVRDRTTAMWVATLPGIINLLGGTVGTYLIEKAGRKGLVLASSIGSVAGLLIMGLGFSMISNHSLQPLYSEYRHTEANKDPCAGLGCDACSYQHECGFCYSPTADDANYSGACVPIFKVNHLEFPDYAAYGRCAPLNANVSTDNLKNFIYADKRSIFKYGYCTTPYSWIPVLGSVIFLAAFSFGYAVVPFTINAEIYPDWARSLGVSIATFVNCLFCWITASTFLSLSTAITRQGNVSEWRSSKLFADPVIGLFFFFACLSAVGTVIVYVFVPETKGMTIDDIQSMLKGSWICRKRNRKESLAVVVGNGTDDSAL